MEDELTTSRLVAVVDDDRIMREALASLVEVLGYEARAFESAEGFLAAHEAGSFGCLITDVRMPGMDGLKLQQGLRKLDPGLPVVFVTSYDDEATRRRATRAGARAVLSKPANADLLDRYLASAIPQ